MADFTLVETLTYTEDDPDTPEIKGSLKVTEHHYQRVRIVKPVPGGGKGKING